MGGDELDDLVGDVCPLPLCLLAQDGEPGLELRRLDVGDQPGQEPAPEAVLEGGDRLRRSVRGDDDLLRGAVQRVERVEELLLEALLVLHELDVVDEEDVALPVAPFEGRRGVRPDRVDELVHERLGRHVPDVPGREVLPHVVPDGVQEVGLSQAGDAVDEQRVVGLGRRLGHRQRSGVREAVGRPGDKGLEGVARVQRRLVGAGRAGRGRAGRARRGRRVARLGPVVHPEQARFPVVTQERLSGC